jgi:hypothetical protein
VATIVTFEPTGNSNVQRIPGLFTDTGVGAGFGDLNGNGVYQAIDISGISSSFEAVLYSQGGLFNAAADVDGDGEVTNLDLFDLGDVLAAAPPGAGVTQALNAYDALLVKRGDVNQDGQTNGADVAALHAGFGASDWLRDLNADGTVNAADVSTLVTDLVRTSFADFNLDRRVDGGDFLTWQMSLGTTGARLDQGDATGDGLVDAADLAKWDDDFGLVGPIISATASAANVPEPGTGLLACAAGLGLATVKSRNARRRAG